MNTVTTVCIIFATVFFCGAMGYLIVVFAHLNKLVIDATRTMEEVDRRVRDINRIVDTLTVLVETTINPLAAFASGIMKATQMVNKVKSFFHSGSSKGDTNDRT